LGFHDTVDKLILRTASRRNGVVVTSDPDFWNPRRRVDRGRDDAPVALFCRDVLGVMVMLLEPFLRTISRRR
jgi:predicted nuclease of predicted toxin-antitoxin system